MTLKTDYYQLSISTATPKNNFHFTDEIKMSKILNENLLLPSLDGGSLEISLPQLVDPFRTAKS